MQALLARPRHHRAAMGAHLDEAAGRELADRFAHRRARHAEAARQLALVERGAGGEQAAHDIVGKRQAQLVGQGPAAAAGDRCGRGDDPSAAPRRSSLVPRDRPSIMLTCAATIRQPSANRTQVCIWRPILPGEAAR